MKAQRDAGKPVPYVRDMRSDMVVSRTEITFKAQPGAASGLQGGGGERPVHLSQQDGKGYSQGARLERERLGALSRTSFSTLVGISDSRAPCTHPEHQLQSKPPCHFS